MKALISVVLALAACSAPAAPSSVPPRPKASPITVPIDRAATVVVANDVPRLRLPKTFVATGYTATLTIDPAQPTFAGKLDLAGEITERTATVWLHAKDLELSVVTAPGTPRLERHGEDLIALRFAEPRAPGPWSVHLEYTGKVDPLNTAGVFVQQSGGASYVFTQLEALYARRVFPCIDEPDSKVPWQLTLEVPNGNIAVSNTSVVKEGAGANANLRRFEFAKTKPLPSYLVAFGVGPFDILDGGNTKSGIPVRIVTPRGRGPDAAYAQQVTAKLIDKLEEYFGERFPYDKLDMLTLPLSIGFGAMENAGLVTQAENIMLFEPKAISWRQKRAYLSVAAHELAHQWFGDYVTMAWWDDLWLNEGFATWLEKKIVAELEPTWRFEQSELDTRNGALGADSLVTARRIRQPIESVDDIYTAFDGITYEKGASVLSMFESYVGADVFRRGVRAYAKAHAFGNATSADFVSAIAEAAGQDLAPAFSTFLDRAGAPELTTKLVCNKGGAHIELTQQRYVASGSPEPAAQSSWQLPVCVVFERLGKRGIACTLLTRDTGSIALGKTCPRWVMPNVEARGYYRVRYTKEQAVTLRDVAWDKLLESEKRAAFFDIADAVRYRQRSTRKTVQVPPTGKLPLPLVLSFVPKLLAIGDRFAVEDAMRVPLSVDNIVADDLRDHYAAYIRETFGQRAKQLGFVGAASDTLDAETTRTSLVTTVAWHGRDPTLVAKAIELAKNWRSLPAATRGRVLAIAVDADADTFTRVLRDVKTEPDRTLRGEMFGALGSVRDPKRYETALELLFDTAVDFRESNGMLLSGTGTEATRQIAERVIRTHEAKLLARMPSESVTGLSGWFSTVFAAGCDKAHRDEAKRYSLEHFGKLPGGERMIHQVFEGMDQCIATREIVEPELRTWLSKIKVPVSSKP